MVYETIYNNLIEKRKLSPPTGYTEKHHIIPRTFGGSDDNTNIIVLTAREHFIAHYLLLKMQVINTPQYHSMRKAFLMMSVISPANNMRYVSGLRFTNLKEEEANYKSSTYIGEGNSQYGTVWICNPITNHNKKIKNDEDIPLGYYKGRGLIEIRCSKCGATFISKKGHLTCSDECRKMQRNDTLISTRRKMSPLTEKDILFIRSNENSYLSNDKIGKMFGVSNVAISYIRNYKSWKDVR